MVGFRVRLCALRRIAVSAHGIGLSAWEMRRYYVRQTDSLVCTKQKAWVAQGLTEYLGGKIPWTASIC